MSSDGYSSEDKVKKEYHSSDDGLPDLGNQTHEFQSDSEDGAYDVDQPDLAPYGSEGSEYAPDDSDAVHSARASDSENHISEDGKELDRSRSPRKRRARSSLNADVELPPVKRAKGSYNRAYLDLLNDDIEDAAQQYIPNSNRVDLPTSQIGLTIWTPVEKEHFFEALGRLGRDDTPGIARRIRTKGELEVRQYMKLLDDALKTRRRHKELVPLELADFPAAVEIGEECSATLEGAADSLAHRQENYEQIVEQKKWGGEFLVTADNYETLQGDDGEDDLLPSIRLFDLSTWLKLSERLFMNSPQEANNWQSISGEAPSIRATALEDFYSLALSMTKRLIVSAIYIAESRIRSKRPLHPTRIGSIVRRKDMEAAVASLGLTPNRTFWAKCPRRLGLHVYEEIPHYKDDDTDPIAYEEVENVLGINDDRHDLKQEWDSSSISSDSSLHDSTKEESDGDASSEGTSSGWEGEDDDIKDEAKEVMLHSAVDRPQTTRERQTLLKRIGAEREQEVYANAMDARATYKEEKRMWRLLGRQPSHPLEKPPAPNTDQRSKLSVDDVYSVGQDWREHVHYVSEWERTPNLGSSGV